MSTRVRRTDPVILFGWWLKAPAIHRPGPNYSLEVTACGKAVGRWSPVLRWDHAQQIGRPCKRCFRDA